MKPEIIPTSESEKVEFKTSFNDDVIETLVAFSNTKGGTVYVGISDSSEVKGLTIGKETIQNWINEIKNKTTPQIIPDVEIIIIDNKTVITLSVTEYPIKPVSIRSRYYKRITNANHLMSIDEIANEHIRTLNTSWDYYFDNQHSLDCISIDKVSQFIKLVEKHSQNVIGISEIEFLNKLEIIRNGKLTYGGYLLFASNYCTISDVQVGRFKSDITIIDSISFNSDIFSEVEDIIAFIKKHLMIEYIITGEPERIERFDFPLDAIREIVINMIVHRDYRDSSCSIVKIFDDRIEFYNPGKLFGGITIDDLVSGKYSSKTRNKLIAKAFKEAGFIERYGTGIARVRNICKDYGLIEPKFEEIAQGFQVVLFKEKINEPINEPINVRQKTIISIIEKNNKISINELSKMSNVGRETIKRDLNDLKKNKIIRRIGSNKNGFWEIISSIK